MRWLAEGEGKSREWNQPKTFMFATFIIQVTPVPSRFLIQMFGWNSKGGEGQEVNKSSEKNSQIGPIYSRPAQAAS